MPLHIESQVFEKLDRVLRHFGVSTYTPDSLLINLLTTELRLVEFLIHLEREFSTQIPDEEVEFVFTVNDLANLLIAKMLPRPNGCIFLSERLP